jgi:hypothetical protein
MSIDKPTTTVFICLGGPHTHKGADCVKGDVIEVRQDQADRLKKHHAAKDATAEQIKTYKEAHKGD